MITVYLCYFIGMYITTVLLHSDSCLYWCLSYICEVFLPCIYASQ